MPGISDDAKRNREDWTQANAAYTDARASSQLGRGRDDLGRLRRSRSRRSAALGDGRRPRRRRARLRHGVRLGLARAARRAAPSAST